jgi:molybdenum cofactor synthesis domain-containing protein
MPRVVNSAAMLLIGNELLSGKVRDDNLHTLSNTLRALGIDLRTASFVKDDRPSIAREMLRLTDEHDVLFTSGGVGPTHDDVTVEALAAAFGVELVSAAELEAMLAREYGEALRDGYQRMTLVPRGAELLVSAEVKWPTIVFGKVWLLPGIPQIFRMKLAVVREHLVGPRLFVARSAYTGLDETELKPLLDATVAAFPSVEIGSYPKWFDPGYRTQVTFDGTDEATVGQALADFCGRLPPGKLHRTE